MPLYVPICEETMARLREVARQERRRPQEQAAVLLEQVLDSRLGNNPDEQSNGEVKRL